MTLVIRALAFALTAATLFVSGCSSSDEDSRTMTDPADLAGEVEVTQGGLMETRANATAMVEMFVCDDGETSTRLVVQAPGLQVQLVGDGFGSHASLEGQSTCFVSHMVNNITLDDVRLDQPAGHLQVDCAAGDLRAEGRQTANCDIAGEAQGESATVSFGGLPASLVCHHIDACGRDRGGLLATQDGALTCLPDMSLDEPCE